MGLKELVKFFSVDFNPIFTNNILGIDTCLTKRTWYKMMFGLIKTTFVGLLTDLANKSNYTECASWSNQKCMTQRNVINLHSIKNFTIQEFYYTRISLLSIFC